MELLTQIVGLLICLALPFSVIGYMAWATRRPSRTCPKCARQVHIKASQCPTCGADLSEAVDEQPAP